ncbi:MAG: type II toxin-antitoxin system RelE/ParE family toxin [Acidobacteriota bacterium]
MIGNYEIRYDRAAQRELENIFEYVLEDAGIARADRWLAAFRKHVDALRITPKIGPVACIRRGRVIRSKLAQSHRVFYTIDEKARLILVIDIVHTARETRLSTYR